MDSIIEEVTSVEEIKTIAVVKFYNKDSSSSFEQQIRVDDNKLFFHSFESRIETVYVGKYLNNSFTQSNLVLPINH